MEHLPMSSIHIRDELDRRFPSYDADTLLKGSLGLLRQGYAPRTVEAHLVLAGCSSALAENVVQRVLLPRVTADSSRPGAV